MRLIPGLHAPMIALAIGAVLCSASRPEPPKVKPMLGHAKFRVQFEASPDGSEKKGMSLTADKHGRLWDISGKEVPIGDLRSLLRYGDLAKPVIFLLDIESPKEMKAHDLAQLIKTFRTNAHPDRVTTVYIFCAGCWED